MIKQKIKEFRSKITENQMQELWERSYKILGPESKKREKVKMEKVEKVEEQVWKKYEYRDWRKILLEAKLEQSNQLSK